MVQRATYQESFKQVAMPQNTGEVQAMGNLANSVGGLIQTKIKQDELKITNYSSQADLDMLNATSKYRSEMALDPMNEQAKQKLDIEYDKIFAKYDDNIGINAKGKWNQTKRILKEQYSASNGKWVLAQNIKNGENNLTEGIKASLKKGYELGIVGDYETAMQTAVLKEAQLRDSANGLVAQDQIEEDMGNFKSDIAKNFIQGRITVDPDEALAMLSNEKIKETIDSEEAINILTTAAKTQKERINKAIDERHKAEFFALSNGLVKDVNSISLADIDQMVVDGMEPSDAKALRVFKTQSVYANKSDHAVYNEVNKMIADGEDDNKITMHLIKNADKLTHEDSIELTKSIGKDKQGIDRHLENTEANSLRDYLTKINNGKVDIEEAVSRFHKSILRNEYKNEKIKEVAEDYKAAYTSMIDPTTNVGKKQIQEKSQDIQKVKEGTIVKNNKTGERMVMREGRWVNL